MKKSISIMIVFGMILSTVFMNLEVEASNNRKITLFTDYMIKTIEDETVYNTFELLHALEDVDELEQVFNKAYQSLSISNKNRLEPEFTIFGILVAFAKDIHNNQQTFDEFVNTLDGTLASRLQEDFPLAYHKIMDAGYSVLVEGIDEMDLFLNLFNGGIQFKESVILVDNHMENGVVNEPLIDAMMMIIGNGFGEEIQVLLSMVDLLDYFVDYYNAASTKDKIILYQSLAEGGFISESDMLKHNRYMERMLSEHSNQILPVYIDVSDFTWAEESVRMIYGLGVLEEEEAWWYEANRYITRAEFAALIVRIFNLEDEVVLPFDDVQPFDWYYQEVQKAYSAGIINGRKENIFEPGSLIMRCEMAVMIQRLLNYFDSNPMSTSSLKIFEDEASIPYWAYDGVGVSISSHIIMGVPIDNTLYYKPMAYTTIAEAMVMIQRLYEQIYH